MKLLMKLLFSNKSAELGVSVHASKNTMGRPGGGIMEVQYWVYKA